MNTAVATAVLIQRIFFCCFDLGGERHRMRARIDAEDDVDLFLVDQPLDLVDRDIGLALRVGVDRHDFVFAGDAACSLHRSIAICAPIDAGDRTAGRERARVGRR